MNVHGSRMFVSVAVACATLVVSASLAAGSGARAIDAHAELARLARIAATTPGPSRQVPGAVERGRSTDFEGAARAALSPAMVADRGADAGLWQTGFGLPSLNEYPSVAIEFRGDLVISGWLRSAGGVKVNGIARWTAQGWQPLGDGVIPAFALVVHDDRLIAASWTGEISSWDGTRWTSLPKPPVDRVDGVIEKDGALYIAGTRAPQAGVVARFDGSTWTQLGGSFDDRVVRLGTYQGRLIAGGYFTAYDGATLRYIAAWDGARWTTLGGGIDAMDYGTVQAIQEFDGRLYVGGSFMSCSGEPTYGLASFDGTAWHALPGCPSGLVYDLLVANRKLWVAGYLYSPGPYSCVKSFDGSAWDESLETLNAWALGLATWGGRVVVAGGFDEAETPAATRPLTNLAVLGEKGWEGFESWTDDQHGLAGNAGAAWPQSAVVYKGNLVVSGMIRLAGSRDGWKRLSGIGQWDGKEWSALGDQIFCSMGALGVVEDDLVFAGILVGNSDEGPLAGAARWDGTRWHPMGQLGAGIVWAVCAYRGSVYVGGDGLFVPSGERTTLARWDGTSWRAVPGAPTEARYNSPRVNALVIRDGRLVVGGNFDTAGGVTCNGVAEWDGDRWSGLGGGPGGEVEALAVHRGDLYAGGMLIPGDLPYGYDGVARWTGEKWSGLGLQYTQVKSLLSYDGRLVISGNAGVDRFVPGSLGLVAWDDGKWTGFGTGLTGAPSALCQWGGDLIAVGSFDHAGGVPASSVARWAGNAPVPRDPSEPTIGMALTASPVTSDEAHLRYAVPASGHARLDVYDVTGARVAVLLDREVEQGEHALVWKSGDPAALPHQGIYFVRLRFEKLETVSKLVIVR